MTGRLSYTALVFLLLAGVIGTQFFTDTRMPKSNSLPPFVLPSGALRVLDLGMHSAAASYMWLAMVQDVNPDSRSRFGSVQEYLEAINNLDPQFAYPYAFGALVLPNFKMVDEGIAVGRRGISAVPGEWIIPYYTGIAYHVYKKDRASATQLFDYTAKIPGVPDNIKAFALNYGSAQDVRQQSRAIWESVYKTSNDEIVLARAKQYLVHYDVVDLLEEASLKYKNRYGKFPKTPEDLVSGKILKAIPPDPFNLTFTFDGYGKAVGGTTFSD